MTLKGGLTGLRLIVVDDDLNTREMLSEVLKMNGADVRAAESVADSLAVLERWMPHVIVSDVGMPEEDGYDLIRLLRSRSVEQGGEVPAIALTGYNRHDDRVRALAAGYQMFVAKPVDLNELIAAIEELARTKIPVAD